MEYDKILHCPKKNDISIYKILITLTAVNRIFLPNELNFIIKKVGSAKFQGLTFVPY